MSFFLARPHIPRQRRHLLDHFFPSITVEDLLHFFELAAYALEGVACDEEHAVDLLVRLEEGLVPVGHEGFRRVAGALVGEVEGVGALAGGEEGVVEGVGRGGDHGELM